MSIDGENDSIRFQLLLGRLFFDSATAAQLAERYGVSVDDVTIAWQFYRRKLCEQLAKSDDAEYRLLDKDELRSRAIECLRLLLDWRDALLIEARVQWFAPTGSAFVDDNPVLNSDSDVAETDRVFLVSIGDQPSAPLPRISAPEPSGHLSRRCLTQPR